MKRLIGAVVGLGLIASPLLATSAAAAAATAPAERKASGYGVKAKINRTTAVAKEDTVKIRGKVTPRAAGARVLLQQRMDGKSKWSVSGRAKIKVNGTYVIKDDPTTAGTRFYRVVKPAAEGMGKGVSKELELVVYKWENLTRRAPGARDNVSFGGVHIGTRLYPFSFAETTPGIAAHVEYTVGRLCTSLRTTYALSDTSATGATGGIKLLVDGVTKVDQSLVVGQVVESTTDLTDAFRLRYELTSNASPASIPVVATPEVLCTK